MMVFRTFEEWSWDGKKFAMTELKQDLTNYAFYPECFIVNNAFKPV